MRGPPGVPDSRLRRRAMLRSYPPCPRNMVELDPSAWLANDPERVEPIRVCRTAMSGDPGACDGCDLGALGARNRVQRMTVRLRCPRLHLDERDGVTPSGD